VTRPRAADDFATIRARMEELRRERAWADAAGNDLLSNQPSGKDRTERWSHGESSATSVQSERPQDLRVDLADLQTLLARTDRPERVEVPIVFLWMKGIRPPFNRQRPTAQIGQLAPGV
jgi:hypothetical protein